MSDEETTQCWACNESIESKTDVCPNCGMPLSNETTSQEDIDNFLDQESDSEAHENTLESPAIPSFGDDDNDLIDNELATPDIPSFGEEEIANEKLSPMIPSFDDDLATESQITSPEIPTFDDIPNFEDDFATDQEMESPALPTFEEFDFEADETEKAGEELETVREINSVSDLTFSQRLKLFVVPALYWYFVFVIISFSSFELVDENAVFSFTGDSLTSTQYKIHVQAFLFGWISFLSMGWFTGYKIKQFGIDKKLRYALISLIINFLVISIFTLTAFTLVNSGTNSINKIQIVLTSYILFTWYIFIVAFLTFGVVLFIAAYHYYWKGIYKITPQSKLIS